ncbi:CDP-diacylglycerol--glycerol-3-phosphate 3-phosphatidyltransferase [Algimonas porphyrae]|uniref:CDP-diacylglycerol--glycerol-3-phosphate 3-phosphatidyltransferase n=1 Tax=Algimonas porphyrae TaxID=1128113 RepID=A0ABQ5V0L3_9PROT|nr:CDP-diacylglycerol--glycerol-3-phosphate 3-phosphatidyltransferase [Algimonas porphyrae]GLQ20151.1 CDP-diacylglycerol--glycerol-3-phosphate 3-phosphatidyltransferase [Algimonas porphyrae]
MTDLDVSARHSLFWLPNALTVSRILLIPVFIIGILSLEFGWGSPFGRLFVLGPLFIIAAFTDWLDGFLARRWNVVTGFGRMIDPIADKLLVAGCLIAFMIATRGHWIFLIPALTIIGRDILVSGAREHAALTGRVMSPTKLAKWKTAFELLAIAALLLWILSKAYLPIDSVIPDISIVSRQIGLVLLWLAAILSAYTGSLYLRDAIRD